MHHRTELSYRRVFEFSKQTNDMTVIVLGNRLHSAEIHGQLRGRMDVGISLFQDVDSEWLLLTGAKTNPDVAATEADVMCEYAVEQGVDPSNIICERNAEDTVGNAYFARRIIEALETDSKTIHVVSSCYHTERAEYIFNQCFGTAYTICTEHCHNYYEAPETTQEEQKLEQVTQLLGTVSPGDIDEIRQQLIDHHTLYDETDV